MLISSTKIKTYFLLKSGEYKSWFIFSIFLIINLIQGIFTPLLNDEPYYWLWSLNLDWGYFDHPPMIAWLIGLGGTLFKSEIGVRIVPVIAGSFTFFFIYKILEKDSKYPINFSLLILLLASSVFLNLNSFVAIPDTPLLFFTVFFFWQFQRFLKLDSTINSVILGIISALLIYSKYHGILVIVFTLLANLNLLKRRSFYIVLITSIILFFPHILWQYNNDFQTIRFYLSDKGNVFKFNNVLSYIGEQALLTGPIILIIFLVKQQTKNKFQRTLKFVSLGIFLFFLVTSIRGIVNAYWTLAAWPGMIILSYFYISELKKKRQIINYILIFNLVLVILLRINFLFNILPIRHFNNRNPKLMAIELKLNSKHPLVFTNMFIDPALYLFYQEEGCFAINNISYKKSQFNYLADLEKKVQGKTVTFVTSSALNSSSREISIFKGRRYFLTDQRDFRSFQCNWEILADMPNEISSNNEIIIPFTIVNKSSTEYPNEGVIISLNMQRKDSKEVYSYSQAINLSSTKSLDFHFIAPSQKGEYKSSFSISNDTLSIMKTYNSNIWNVTSY